MRAHDSSLAAVTLLAQLCSFPSAVAFAVARVAIASATAWYFSTRTSVGDCSSASLPNGFCLLSTCAGRPLPGLVVSPSRSRIVLLYS